MTTSRALFILSILAALLVAAAPTASAQSRASVDIAGTGGTPAGPPVVSRGGGSVAPAAPQRRPSRRDAEAAQEEEPTTGGGEEQGGTDEPAGGVEGDTGGGEVPGLGDEPAGEEVTPPAGETPSGGTGASQESGASYLPTTGLEIASVAVIGLGLLMLGAALRPRRRVASGRR
jgi:hypothetical protein